MGSSVILNQYPTIRLLKAKSDRYFTRGSLGIASDAFSVEQLMHTLCKMISQDLRGM
jgi:hypothetical protein